MEEEKKSKDEERRCAEGVQKQKRKRKEIFPFGNYRNYYGYRIGQDMEEDPRLKVMKKEWLEGKDCLDIGCNNGSITIQIARKFHCKSILGVDIDSNRIEDAYWHLRKFAKMDEFEKKQGRTSRSKVSEDANGLGNNAAASSDDETKQSLRSCSSEERDLSDIVSFQQENFVQSRHPQEKHYDTILWQGGILVLEPQPWKSYQNNYRISETTTENYKKISFRPAWFQEILLDKIGFRTVEDVTSSLSGTKSGFNRPILVFRK
ncbi:7SK snRNA methylphosphate capping enzyme [Morus notabilis]|uniref:RNA methyltransferase n=1 Tax=Morus notabilis TaxID=981085 RepID=W9S7D2_9ROSA|nr:7SK snRNA methylphosphate capping enzyme [Morus notabilis]